MWSDNETELDLLGVSHLAAAVKQIITSKHLLPTTIGLFGDWGSGKSSLSCQLQKDLGEDKKILCVTFNGWQQEDFEDAKLALMGTLLDALVENRDAWNKAKDLVGRLAGRINRMKLGELLLRVGAPIATVVAAAHGADPNMLALAASQGVAGVKPEDLKDVIKSEAGKEEEPLRKSAREFRKDFEELLDKTGVETLVVFIDDLDRCLPDTVVDTLEAVRLFLYTPRTAFVICADPRVVRAAVRHRYPQSEDSPELPNEYLEKLVQFAIPVTPLAPPDVSRYMTLLFAELHIGQNFTAAIKNLPSSRQELESLAPREIAEKLQSPLPTELSEAVAIVEQVGDDLASHLNGNPRQVKRFLNLLMLRMGMAADRGAELDRRILAKLMLLEYLRPDQFRQLATWQASQLGRSAELKRLEADQTASIKPAIVAGKKATGSSGDGNDSADSGADETAIAFWRTDAWLKRWAGSEPALSDTDLRPYFYVSREALGTIVVPGLRLSALAERTLGELLSTSKAQRTKAVRAAKELADHDARSLFLAITERCRKTEKLDVAGSPLETLIEMTKARPELTPDVLQVIASLPHSSLGPGVPPLVAALGNTFVDRKAEIERIQVGWGESTNPMLAAAAKKMVGR